MKGVVIIGMPCSGKTSSCKYLKEKGYTYYSTGDIVRELCSEAEGYKSSDSTDLGEFSTKRRQEDAAYATKEALRRLREKEEESVVVLEGVRCIEEIDYLEKELESVLTLFIKVPFEERSRRMIERGREGENNKNIMRERDTRELDWGLEEILELDYYDKKINGNCSKKKLFEKVEKEVEKFRK